MATITVRNLNEDIVDRLKAVAEENGRSMEQEVRELLEARFAPKADVLDRVRARWKKTKGPSRAEVADWRSEGRR